MPSGYLGYPRKRGLFSQQGFYIPIVLSVVIMSYYMLTHTGVTVFSTGEVGIWVLGFFTACATLYNPIIGLGITLVAIGLSPEVAKGGIALRIEDLVIPLVIFAWVTRSLLYREKIFYSPLHVPMFCMLFVGAMSSLAALSWGNLDFQTSMFHFLKQVEYVFLFLLAFHIIHTEKNIRIFTIMLVLSSVAVGVLGLTQAREVVSGVSNIKRVTGPFGETANIFGGYIAFHVVLAVSYLIHEKSKRMRVLLMFYLLCLGIPLIYTLSRGSFVAMFVGLIVIGLFANRKLLLGIVAVITLVFLLSPGNVVERYLSILDVFSRDAPSAWLARRHAWTKFGQWVIGSPLLGKGVGSIELGAVDNEYLKVAVESGLLGLFLFMFILLRSLRISWVVARETDNLAYRAFAYGFLGGVVTLMVHAITATTFTAIRTAEMFYVVTGIMLSIYRNEQGLRRRPWFHRRKTKGAIRIASFRRSATASDTSDPVGHRGRMESPGPDVRS